VGWQRKCPASVVGQRHCVQQCGTTEWQLRNIWRHGRVCVGRTWTINLRSEELGASSPPWTASGENTADSPLNLVSDHAGELVSNSH